MKVYVASSWRNKFQPGIVGTIAERGHQVYDFRNPAPGEHGFSWSEIDPDWEGWSAEAYRNALKDPIAQLGFARDMTALRECDACVLVLPCGRSAHLELGWAVGAGKHTAILHPGGVRVEPELMALMVGAVLCGVDELHQWIDERAADRSQARGREITFAVHDRTNGPRSLGEALPLEMARVRDRVMPIYQSIGQGGAFALASMRNDLDLAAKAMAEGDVVEMLRLYRSLKSYET